MTPEEIIAMLRRDAEEWFWFEISPDDAQVLVDYIDSLKREATTDE